MLAPSRLAAWHRAATPIVTPASSATTAAAADALLRVPAASGATASSGSVGCSSSESVGGPAPPPRACVCRHRTRRHSRYRPQHPPAPNLSRQTCLLQRMRCRCLWSLQQRLQWHQQPHATPNAPPSTHRQPHRHCRRRSSRLPTRHRLRRPRHSLGVGDWPHHTQYNTSVLSTAQAQIPR